MVEIKYLIPIGVVVLLLLIIVSKLNSTINKIKERNFEIVSAQEVYGGRLITVKFINDYKYYTVVVDKKDFVKHESNWNVHKLIRKHKSSWLLL